MIALPDRRHPREEPEAPPQLRVLVLDVETTGTNREVDQVIELAVRALDEEHTQAWRFRPTVPIHPGAQAAHGISAEMLAGEPLFAERAAEVRRCLSRADVLCGYNVGFDIAMLEAELRRAGMPLALGAMPVIDPYRLWQQMEPRGLLHAHRRFAGGDFDGAHSAAADIEATARVLRGMVAAFDLATKGPLDLADLCAPERRRWVGPSAHIQRRDDGVPVFAFGKHADRPVHEAVRRDRGYLDWMRGRDFPPHVLDICRLALDCDVERFRAAVSERYPEPGA